MSITKAINLSKTIRWHHLGFSFLWAILFTGLVYPASATSGEMLTLSTTQLLCTVLILVVLSIRERVDNLQSYQQALAIVLGVLLAVGVGLFYVAFYLLAPGSVFRTSCVVVSGALLGLSSGAFYALWQAYYTSEGASRTALYIPLSAVTSAVLAFVMRPLSLAGTIVFAAVVFPVLATISLRKALAEIVLPAQYKAPRLRKVMADLWRPVVCVSSVAFVWKFISGILENASASVFFEALVGFAAAALIIALIELFSDRGFRVLGSYQMLFPLMLLVLPLPVFFGGEYYSLLLVILMFGFETVNLLLIITCAVYANNREVQAIPVYALCLCPVYLAMILGDLLSTYLGAPFAAGTVSVGGIMFVGLYVLSATMFVVSWANGRASMQPVAAAEERPVEATQKVSEEQTEPSLLSGDSGVSRPSPQDFESKLALMATENPLSNREVEIAALIARGHSAASIARRLYISENTVRGHVKNVYRKLEIHSKQQLIDLLSGE